MTPDKIQTKLKVTAYDFDPDATTETDAAWVDMQNFDQLLVMFVRTVGASDVTLEINANTASDGSGDEATIVTKTFSAQPDAVGDHVFLECLAEQIAQQAAEDGKDYRYVSATLSFATATDEGVVVYIRDGARFKYDGLTADYIS